MFSKLVEGPNCTQIIINQIIIGCTITPAPSGKTGVNTCGRGTGQPAGNPTNKCQERL